VVFDQDVKKYHRNRRRLRDNRQLTARNRRSSSRHDHIYRYISIRITKTKVIRSPSGSTALINPTDNHRVSYKKGGLSITSRRAEQQGVYLPY